MSKKQFTLDSWLKDKSQKVVTRCGFPVRIVCTDVKRKDYPILALVERDDQEEYQSFTKDGRFSLYNPLHDNFDLFIETADEVSEDEKIRKRLITDFGTIGKKEWGGLEVKDILAWLERQGEHANFLSKIQVGDKVTKNEAGVLVNLSQLKRVAKPNEEQGEQKASCTSIVETGNGGINALVTRELPTEMKLAEESLGIDSDTYNKIVDECIFGEQKPEENKGNIGEISPTWSEEDEKNLRRAIRATKVVYPVAADWLRSLQDRVQPQHKQKWSEEDERERKRVVGLLEGWLSTFKETCYAEDCKCGIGWLKSLRPQSRWKPSDEQMGCLSDAIEHYNSLGYPAPKLKELLDDLKELKGEV